MILKRRSIPFTMMKLLHVLCVTFLFASKYHGSKNLFHVLASVDDDDTKSECSDLSFIEPGWLKNQYTQHLYIPTKSDSCKGMKFYWKIINDTIQVTVVAKTSGWIGFGFSETGGMRGADIAYFIHENEEVVDSYVRDGYVKPSVDNEQDWELLNHELLDDGHLLFEVERLLDSKDPYDRKFVDDSDVYFPDHNLIGAWGDSSDIMFHGSQVVQTKIQLFINTDTDSSGSGYSLFLDQMVERSEGYVDLIDTNFTIPKTDTHYETFCFPTPLSPEVPSTAYIVGYEWLIPSSLTEYIHHIVLETRNFDYDECYGGHPPFVAYTLGNKFFAFPEDSAIILADENSLYGFDLQYHFNNPMKDDVVNINSGIRLYYTSVPVTNEIGSFWSGDPSVEKEGDKVGNGLSVHKFDCPSNCTKLSMIDDTVTVISESYHMHGKGKRAFNEIIRDGEVVRKTAIDYWDFDQTGVAAVQRESFELKKGDVISTSCYFDTGSDDVFGLGTPDEMCMTILLYYPRQPNLFICGLDFHDATCSASYEYKLLSSEEELGRKFGYDEPNRDGPNQDELNQDEPNLDEPNPDESMGIKRNGNHSFWVVILCFIGHCWM